MSKLVFGVLLVSIIVALVSAKFAFEQSGTRVTIMGSDVHTASDETKESALYVMIGSICVSVLVVLVMIFGNRMQYRTTDRATF